MEHAVRSESSICRNSYFRVVTFETSDRYCTVWLKLLVRSTSFLPQILAVQSFQNPFFFRRAFRPGRCCRIRPGSRMWISLRICSTDIRCAYSDDCVGSQFMSFNAAELSFYQFRRENECSQFLENVSHDFYCSIVQIESDV